MALDPRTPVLVGVGAHTRHPSEADAGEAIELMAIAIEQAARDASPRLLDRCTSVMVPNGTWRYADPGRMLAARCGLGTPTTVLAEVGILQQHLLDLACTRIAEGVDEVVVIVGGEAKQRALQAAVAGVEAPETTQAVGTTPDVYLAPHDDIITGCEIEREMAVPAVQYAMIDRCLAHHDGLDHRQHLDRLGRLWAGLASTAANAPEAWDRSAPDAHTIVSPTPQNRLISAPYTKLLCSQWNVDQAAALVVCSVEAAERAGVAHDRWVFPWAGACSTTMIPLPERAELHRAESVLACAAATRGHTGTDAADVEVRDIYSCFPAAVQVQCRELGIALTGGPPLSLTGGMTFGGGPLNNYALQAMVALARALRSMPEHPGVSTSVSGMLTKVGLGLWAAAPPPVPYRAFEVRSDESSRRPLMPELTGTLVVVGSTVVCDRGEPARAVVVAEDAAGARTIAGCARDDVVVAMTTETLIGTTVDVHSPGQFSR